MLVSCMWVSHMCPCLQETAWEGDGSTCNRVRNFFPSAFCKWVFNSEAQKTSCSLLLSTVDLVRTGNTSESLGPRLKFQAGS